MSKPVLYIDPGHGGHDPGAVNTATGLQEKDVVLDVSQRLLNYCEPFFKVYLTRNRDLYLPLAKRAALANKGGADYFLSIHCNAASAPTAHGYECFTSKGRTLADSVATDLMDCFGEEFENRRARKDESDGDPDKEASFTVLTKTAKSVRATLFELEFIHNAQGSAFLGNDANKDRMAKALFKGLMRNAGLSEEPAVEVAPEDAGPSRDMAELKAAMQRVIDSY